MPDILIRDMQAEFARCTDLAAGYRMTGEYRLKMMAITAAHHLAMAANVLAEFEAAQAERVPAGTEA